MPSPVSSPAALPSPNAAGLRLGAAVLGALALLLAVLALVRPEVGTMMMAMLHRLMTTGG